MPRVYVSIGSNIEREKNVRGAIEALRKRFGTVSTSAVYRSKADGFDGDDFYNLVAGFDTDDSLERLRDALGQIEAAHGRRRTPERYGPRTLDLDILLYGKCVRHKDGFEIPRRDIVEQPYVLRPLAEIAPDVRHPETGERLADLWLRWPEKGTLERVALDLSR